MDPGVQDADDGEVLHDADVVRKPANIGFAIPIARAAPILAELARTGS